MNKEKAVVLLSGGLDSSTTLAYANREGFELYTLSFNYGQRAKIELKYAKEISEYFNVKKHLVINIDLRKIGGSALTSSIEVPKGKEINSSIPITYVPARNTIFLSYALAFCEVLPAYNIFIGANSIDYSGYPDCRPEYILAYENMANFASKNVIETKRKIHINTPIISLKKSEIIKLGISLGVDFSRTFSCYDPDELGRACGLCDSCRLRIEGFKETGLTDPIEYSNIIKA